MMHIDREGTGCRRASFRLLCRSWGGALGVSMRPKIAMWSDYGAPRHKHWRAPRRSSRSSIGPMILAAAVVVVAGVIGISGLYPQIIDSEWVQGMSTRSQRVTETARENGISGIYPQIIDSEWVQGMSTRSQRVTETAPE